MTNETGSYGELGVTGLTRFGGKAGQTLREDFLRELQGSAGRKLYSQMRWNDPVINAVFFAMEWSMRHVRFFAEPVSDKPEDKRAAELVDQCLNDMSFSWSDTLSFILTMWEYGFSILEVVGKRRLGSNPPKYAGMSDPATSQYNDGLWAWRKWAPRPADSLASGSEWLFDDSGGIQGCVQSAPPDYVMREIPIGRMLLFRTSVAPKNSPESQPILRGMYMPYYFKTNIAEIEAIGIERDLAGLPIGYLGTDCSLSGTDSDYEKAKDLVRNVRRDEQEGIVIPKPKLGTAAPGQGMLFELLSTGGRRQFDTDAIINRYDKRIAMTVLAQFVMLGMEQVGSYALSELQGNFFGLALGGWADSIADTIQRYAVSKLFAYNQNKFNIDQLPRLAHSEVGVPNLPALADYVNKLVGAQVLSPDPSLETYLRETARLPQKEAREGGYSEFAQPTYDYLVRWKSEAEKRLPGFWQDKINLAARGHAGGKAYPRNVPIGEEDALPEHVARLEPEQQTIWRRIFNATLKAMHNRETAQQAADEALGLERDEYSELPDYSENGDLGLAGYLEWVEQIQREVCNV